MACPDATLVSSLVASQVPQIQEKINYYILVNSPFANVVNGDTFESNQGDDILNAVTNRTAPGHSLTRPAFIDRANACGLDPSTDEFGQTLFSATMQTLRGRGPDVCVKQAVSAVKNSYLSAQRSLQENVSNLVNVDIRAQIHDLSGVKFTAIAATQFESLISGGLNQVSVNYIGTLPDSAMSFAALELLSQYMTDTLKLKKFGSGANAHYRVITGTGQNQIFRNEAGVNTVLLGALQGSFGDGKEALWGYAWTDMTYRGLALGIDEEPLRFNCLDVSGNPIFIEPIVEVAGDRGKNGIVNPEWQTAKYEVGFIIAPNNFTRYVPAKYIGEGTFKFAPQMSGGALNWFYSVDCNNEYGDVGHHNYEIERAYSPQQPHAVIPFMYARVTANTGLTSASLYSNTDTCPV